VTVSFLPSQEYFLLQLTSTGAYFFGEVASVSPYDLASTAAAPIVLSGVSYSGAGGYILKYSL
jgi:hypothetical protein